MSAGTSFADPALEESQSRKPSKWLRKTKLCNYNVANNCTFGANCLFAHSAAELQDIPDLYKTQLCPDFANGLCTNEQCNFAHGEEELKPFPTLKQKLCKWHRKGKCHNGDACCFAHGRKDLRTGNSETESNQPDNAPATVVPLTAASSQKPKAKQPPLGQQHAPAWQPPVGMQCPPPPVAPKQATWEEIVAQTNLQLQASQVNELMKHFVGQQAGDLRPPQPAKTNKVTFDYKAGQGLTFEYKAGQSSSKTAAAGNAQRELIYSWRRTPLSSKGVPFVPSSGLQFDVAEDDMSTCAETAGYLSD
jgi:hypothetical protein